MRQSRIRKKKKKTQQEVKYIRAGAKETEKEKGQNFMPVQGNY